MADCGAPVTGVRKDPVHWDDRGPGKIDIAVPNHDGVRRLDTSVIDEAMRGGEHPFAADNGAATEVPPGSIPPAGGTQRDLPRELPLTGPGSAYDEALHPRCALP